MSQFGLAIFLYAKNFQNPGEIGWPARVFISMTLLPAMNASGAGRHGRALTNSANHTAAARRCVCVLEHACVHASVHAHA